MQTAINPALAAAMTLEQAAQMGEFSPVTKDGIPTVVGGKLQQALQPMMGQGMQPSMPGVQNVAQQAGIGGQIQAMQMQEAQKAMMNAAMQQAKPPAGIERLNPKMGNFAEGGIVGYAPGGVSEEFGGVSEMEVSEPRLRVPGPRGDRMMTPAEMRAENYPEEYIQRRLQSEGFTSRPTAPKPAAVVETAAPPQAAPTVAPPAAPVAERPMAAPAAAPGPGGIEALFEKERAGYRGMKGPATPKQIVEQERRTRAVKDEYLRSLGIDPDAFTKRSEEDKALMEQQRALLRERMEREKGRDTFLGRAGEAFRNFSQMKGQGAGPAIARSYDALSRRLEAGEARMDQMRDFELKLNELEINRRRSLDDARRATAEGNWKGAEQSMNNANAFTNEIEKMVAGTFGKQAAQTVEQQKAREAGAARMVDQQRVQELYQLRLNSLAQGKPPTDEQKMQAMEYALQTVRGAGGAARAQTAADALALKRQELASKVPAYNLAQMTAYSTSPSITEEKRQKAREVMAQIEAQYGISGGPAPTGASAQIGTPEQRALVEKYTK